MDVNGRREPGGLRVISANLWNGSADPEEFAALVAALRPDAVAVQEMTTPQADALAEAMPHGVLEPADDFFGMGIALRTPGDVRRLALPYRDAWVANLTVTARDGSVAAVEIINVHVQAPHSPPSWACYRNRRGQLEELERYLDENPQPRRIVVGDLNSTPRWPWYRRMRTRFVDAAEAAASQNAHRPQPTWGPWPGSPRLLRIDHALVSGLGVRAFRVLPVRGADHSAIVVDFALP